MPISRDTDIREVEFIATPSGGHSNSRLTTVLWNNGGFRTYGDLVDYVDAGKDLKRLRNIGPDYAEALQEFVEAQKVIESNEEVQPISKSFSITTPGMSLSEKIEVATASVADDMREIAKDLFRKGAVVIEPR
jgi:hypothetical protein